MIDIIMDALLDTAKLLPFLVVIYFLVSYLEYRLGDRLGTWVTRYIGLGPVVGALLGCLPQCGFSVMAATLYTKRLVSVGTLLAVFISTSDEAIPLLLSMPEQASIVAKLLIVKVVIAIIVGLAVDLLLNRVNRRREAVTVDENISAVQGHRGCCAHDLCETRPKWQVLFWHPLKHALKIAAFLLFFSVLLGLLIEKVGGQRLEAFLLSGNLFQPVLTSIIGLIPNCFTSVFLVELYVKNAIAFGGLIAGLCSAAGLGLLVLFRENGDLKDTLRILGILILSSSIAGILISQYKF